MFVFVFGNLLMVDETCAKKAFAASLFIGLIVVPILLILLASEALLGLLLRLVSKGVFLCSNNLN